VLPPCPGWLAMGRAHLLPRFGSPPSCRRRLAGGGAAGISARRRFSLLRRHPQFPPPRGLLGRRVTPASPRRLLFRLLCRGHLAFLSTRRHFCTCAEVICLLSSSSNLRRQLFQRLRFVRSFQLNTVVCNERSF
jgi:hypothetical protein